MTPFRKILRSIFGLPARHVVAAPSALVAELNEIFKTISRGLFAGSLNYCANFCLVQAHGMAGKPIEKAIASAIGKECALGGVCAATATEVLEEFRDGLEYKGDEGSHPGRRYLTSVRFTEDKNQALAQLGVLLDGASDVFSFWLKSGHPFYPVFWDFAFFIEKGADAFVFIGSSSD